MKNRELRRCLLIAVSLCSWLAGKLPSANGIPSFESFNSSLPNPDRPYQMVGGTVRYDSVPDFAIYDLEFEPSNPSQLDLPSRNADGSLEFDSTFDITYKAVVSVSTQPPQMVSGIGTARARGFAPADPTHDPNELIWPNPQVFDTELVTLNLFALSPIPEVMFRESPTVRSSGVTIRENTCPFCLSPFTHWRISSFFDISTEITFNGGVSWTAARDVIHVEQAPDGYPPGDYNKDKVVDIGDFVVWRKTLGETGAGLAADGNWSGEVDAEDYAVWKMNFARNAVTASTNAAIPEPASVVLFLLGMSTMLARRCRIAGAGRPASHGSVA
jgi:hypothetical protein